MPSSRKTFIARTSLADYLGLLVILAALVALFGNLSEHFFTQRTFYNIANQVPDLTVIAVGMTLVLIVAGIDLSVGSVMAFSSALLGVALVQGEWPLWAAILAAVGTGLACGLVNGFVSVWWSIPSFIVTLGMLEIARGGAYLATDSTTQYIGSRIEGISAQIGDSGFSPAFIVAVVVVILGQLLLDRTVFGRYILGIGANETVITYSGINPRPLKIAVFAICGALAGLGGVFQVSRLQAADPNAGVGLELSAIAAVVIGGTSLMGGRGNVVNSFFGVLIIAVLQTGLAQIGASEPSKRVITGSVIVIAVIADVYRRKFAELRRRRLQDQANL